MKEIRTDVAISACLEELMYGDIDFYNEKMAKNWREVFAERNITIVGEVGSKMVFDDALRWNAYSEDKNIKLWGKELYVMRPLILQTREGIHPLILQAGFLVTEKP
jgi:hypothetical protein